MSDVETLSEFKLTFKSYRHDLDGYIEELVAQRVNETGITKKKKMCIALIASDEVYRAYAKKGLWLILAADLIVGHYKDQGGLEITEGLMALKEYSVVKRLWRRYLAERKSQYWYYLTKPPTFPVGVYAFEEDRQAAEAEYHNVTWPEIRDEAPGALRMYRDLVIRMNDPAELARVEDELGAIETGQRRKPKKKKPDATKMDDSEFWNIIDTSIQTSDGSIEAKVEYIANRLEDFKSTEIKRFQTILLDKLDELNTWDLWALIYIAQGGCSDDSFRDFRCWVILQGKKFFNQCISNIEEAMRGVPNDGTASNESLSYAADIAYDTRSGGKP